MSLRRKAYLQALEIRERIHDVQGMSYSLGNLAALELDLENYGEARALFEKSLRLARQSGERFAIASYLASLGDVALWDNRNTQHFAVPDYTEDRVLQRVEVTGERPVGPDASTRVAVPA